MFGVSWPLDLPVDIANLILTGNLVDCNPKN